MHLIGEDLGLTVVAGATVATEGDWLHGLDEALAVEAQEYLARRDRFAKFLRERGDEAPI